MDAGPDRIELRTQMRQVTFDFTNAVITSRILRIDADMKLGKPAIGSAPGIEIVGTLNDAKAVERRP